MFERIQQALIDVLDRADRIHIKGRGSNCTDLYIKMADIDDYSKQTTFHNCLADCNIPVGEVYTTPVLEGTDGILNVNKVFINGLEYRDLKIEFKDGMTCGYSCANYDSDKDNTHYVRDNLMNQFETLPMGEFAIGTNTTAYRMAKDFQIADKLPILIAEKTGPHFAVGDTCYSHAEDTAVYNPDGKEIMPKDNELTRIRKEDASKAYFNCHTDITIPYDELDRITAILPDGQEIDVICDGKFVVPGTEELNQPLESENICIC